MSFAESAGLVPEPYELPEDVDRGGVEVTMGYRPEPTLVLLLRQPCMQISLDVETGMKVLDYVIVRTAYHR